MSKPGWEAGYPASIDFQEHPPLRIPSGWTIGWHTLRAYMATDLSGIGGSSLFSATNAGRRFNIDVEFRPEFDPDGAFHLTVLYQPWPRTERGRRVKDAPLILGLDAETVHTFETRSYEALLAELEHWIGRCTVWAKEQN